MMNKETTTEQKTVSICVIVVMAVAVATDPQMFTELDMWQLLLAVLLWLVVVGVHLWRLLR